MLYPVAIESGGNDKAYGVTFPDVPDCFSAGETIEDALLNAREALELHFEALADEGILPPSPSEFEVYQGNPEYAGWIWALVEVDVEPYMSKASKINA